MHTSILSLGSNVGDRHYYLCEAKKMIQAFAVIELESKIYETAPWQIEAEQANYYNQIIQIKSSLSPFALLDNLLSIEHLLGRERKQKWAARTIDLDILFFEQQIINTAILQIPHPRIQERKFVLIPLMELGLQDFIHPSLQVNILKLYKHCKDNKKVSTL